MQIVIRPATVEDSEAMRSISSRAHLTGVYDTLIPQQHRRKFESRYQFTTQSTVAFREMLRRRLALPHWHYLVASEDDRVIAYTCAILTPSLLELRGLFVDPDQQGQGAGSALFKASVELSEGKVPVRLKVLRGNKPAEHLYEKSGFEVIDTVSSSFYGADIDVMERDNY